ncbi:HAMP domain-containing histidine kinase [Saprospiraceae bacterium]|nr:HAMP domain-containing histidine kinase [Saprospiraceae bacterium]
MKNIKVYRILHFIIMAYMLTAFAWWAILLNKKNEENYHLKNRILHVDKSYSVQDIEIEYQTQKKMIIGEGLVFGISLLFGLFLINKAFWTEIKANKTRSNFLLSVTHELKTPIASLNLINKTLATKNLSADKNKTLLKAASEEGRRIESLVNNILTAAQIEQSYTYNLEATDLSELIRNYIRRTYILNDIHRVRHDLGEQVIADVDPEAFASLLNNLLDNAIKYTPDESQIDVLLKHSSNQVTLQVIDKGIGITDIEKKQVLQKFYRVGNEDTRESKGTGLGLFIVKQIVGAHKGSLKIQDNIPKGTIIEIILPKKKR